MKKYALLLLFMLGVTFNGMAQSKSEGSYKTWHKYYTLEKDGTLKMKATVSLSLNTHTSFNSLFGESFILYNPKYQTVTINECYTIMADGTKVMVPENAMSEMLPRAAADAPAYNHLREIVITHTGLEVNATIVLSYTIETRPEYTNGELDFTEIIPQKGADMLWNSVSVTVPKDVKLNWCLSENSSQPFHRSTDSTSVYTWTFGRQDQIENIPNTPKHKGITRLYVSTLPIENSLALIAKTTKDIVRIEPEQMAAAKTEAEKVNIISTYMKSKVELCDIPHYLNNYRHHAPSEVERRGYGTKADKAFLFDRLLSGEGISSDIIVSYPLDCTAPNMSGYENMYVMATVDGTNKFYDVNGELVQLELIADRYKFYSVKTGKEVVVEFKENVGTFTADVTINGNEVETKALKNGENDGAKAKLIDCGNFKMLQLPESKLTDWGISNVYSKRITTIELPTQLNLTETYSVKLDNGQFVSENKNVNIEHKIGRVNINISISGNTAKIERKLDMDTTIITKQDILKFKEILNAWNDDNLLKLIIK